MAEMSYRDVLVRVPPGRHHRRNRQRMHQTRHQKWRQPCQPHPGTRRHCYRCFLPDLAGFTAGHCGGTDRAAIELPFGEGGIVAKRCHLCKGTGANPDAIKTPEPALPSPTTPADKTALPASADRSGNPALHRTRANQEYPAARQFRHPPPAPSYPDVRSAR